MGGGGILFSFTGFLGNPSLSLSLSLCLTTCLPLCSFFFCCFCFCLSSGLFVCFDLSARKVCKVASLGEIFFLCKLTGSSFIHTLWSAPPTSSHLFPHSSSDSHLECWSRTGWLFSTLPYRTCCPSACLPAHPFQSRFRNWVNQKGLLILFYGHVQSSVLEQLLCKVSSTHRSIPSNQSACYH